MEQRKTTGTARLTIGALALLLGACGGGGGSDKGSTGSPPPMVVPSVSPTPVVSEPTVTPPPADVPNQRFTISDYQGLWLIEDLDGGLDETIDAYLDFRRDSDGLLGWTWTDGETDDEGDQCYRRRGDLDGFFFVVRTDRVDTTSMVFSGGGIEPGSARGIDLEQAEDSLAGRIEPEDGGTMLRSLVRGITFVRAPIGTSDLLATPCEDDDDFVIIEPNDEFNEVVDGSSDDCDVDSRNGDWSDNCTVRLDGLYADSTYTLGVQRILHCSGYLASPGAGGGSADSINAFGGRFDIDTEEAVAAFQFDRGLEPDGIVGSQTWSMLQGEVSLTGDSRGDLLAARVPGGIGCGFDLFFQRGTEPFDWFMADVVPVGPFDSPQTFGIRTPFR